MLTWEAVVALVTTLVCVLAVTVDGGAVMVLVLAVTVDVLAVIVVVFAARCLSVLQRSDTFTLDTYCLSKSMQ